MFLIGVILDPLLAVFTKFSCYCTTGIILFQRDRLPSKQLSFRVNRSYFLKASFLPIWTPMIFSRTNTFHDDSHTVPRSPIDFFSFFSVIVTDSISIFFVKFICIDVGSCEFSTKISNRIIH